MNLDKSFMDEIILNRDALKKILTRQQNKLTVCKFIIQKYKLQLKELQEDKKVKLIKCCCCCSCSCQHPRSTSSSSSSLYSHTKPKSLSIPDLRSKCQELSEINERMASQVNVISSAFDNLASSSPSLTCSSFQV